MVRNNKGGKHKHKARKDYKPRSLNIEQLKKIDGQEYGFVKEKYSSQHYKLLCYDKVERLGCLRGKLRKARIKNSDLVLVSIRDFQDDKCDIIQKYSDEQRDVLILKNEITESFAKDGKTFSNEYEDNISYESGSSSTSKNTSKAINVENLNDMEEINIDDI